MKPVNFPSILPIPPGHFLYAEKLSVSLPYNKTIIISHNSRFRDFGGSNINSSNLVHIIKIQWESPSLSHFIQHPHLIPFATIKCKIIIPKANSYQGAFCTIRQSTQSDVSLCCLVFFFTKKVHSLAQATKARNPDVSGRLLVYPGYIIQMNKNSSFAENSPPTSLNTHTMQTHNTR